MSHAATIARIRELREAGVPQLEIAARLGLRYASVRKYCAQYGIRSPVEHRGGKPQPDAITNNRRGPGWKPRAYMRRIDPERAKAITDAKRRYWETGERSA